MELGFTAPNEDRLVFIGLTRLNLNLDKAGLKA